MLQAVVPPVDPDTAPIDLPPLPTRRVETRTVWSDVWYLLMRIRKFIVAIVGAAATAAYTLPPDLPSKYNWQEYVPTAIAFLTALGVLGTKNKEKG